MEVREYFLFLVRCKWNAAETLLTGGRSRHTCVTESSSCCSGSHQRVELLLLWWMRQNVPAHVNVSELIGWTWTSDGSSGLQQFTVQSEYRCSESSASPQSLTFKQKLAFGELPVQFFLVVIPGTAGWSTQCCMQPFIKKTLQSSNLYLLIDSETL